MNANIRVARYAVKAAPPGARFMLARSWVEGYRAALADARAAVAAAYRKAGRAQL